jgi:hypothetical protein
MSKIKIFKKGNHVQVVDGTMATRKGKVVSIYDDEIGVRIGKEVLYFKPSNLKIYGGFVAKSFNTPALKHFKNTPNKSKD